MAAMVNPQITDAVTQTSVQILGDAPGQAMAALFTASASALALAAQNGSIQGQSANTVLQATTTQGVALLYGVDTAATAVGINEILQAKPNVRR